MKLFKTSVSSDDLKHDFVASIVVFLVALPLCMGIAIACGVPPAQGLITGIVGGIIVGFFSGAPLLVSGPAAGLTVLVFDIMQRHGLATLALIVIAAGAVQILAGMLKLGRWFRAVSPAVIHGMLAGIGILLCASQFHVMLDKAPQSSGLPNLLAMPRAIWETITLTGGFGSLFALGLGLFTLAVLVIWKYFGLDKRLHVPGHLPAIAGATIIAQAFSLPVHYVPVPDSLIDAISFAALSNLGQLIHAPVLLAALSVALIASAETLLSATAVDQIQKGPRAKYDRELMAQGFGNMLCGLFGGLPMTGVVARSTVNLQAGARTRWATIMHGLLILIAVALIPFVLKMIPIAALAGLLVFTGFKLVDTAVFKQLRAYGHNQATIYLVTIGFIVSTDLLIGVFVGFTLSLVRLILTMVDLNIETRQDATEAETVIEVKGTATFLGLPKLAEALESLPADRRVRVDVKDLVFIDHACLELFSQWEKRHVEGGGQVSINWDDLRRLCGSPADVAGASSSPLSQTGVNSRLPRNNRN
jgi:MFS superfamily sulfate permease-like transporter